MAVGPTAASPLFAAAIHAFPPSNATATVSDLDALLVNGVGLTFGSFALLLLMMAALACAFAREVSAAGRKGVA